MRTAIFVQEPSTVTIRAGNARDGKVEICRYGRTGEPAIGTHQLERGIYLIVSNSPVAIDGLRGDVETRRNNKDDWPDPKPGVVALEPGASAASIRKFLTIAKDFSPHG